MTRCVVVGRPERVSGIRGKLESNHVSANAIGNALSNEQIVASCALTNPEVVVVFVRDFSLDNRVPLLSALRRRLGEQTPLHVFTEMMESRKEMGATRKELVRAGAGEVVFSLPISSVDAAQFIIRHWL